MVKIPYGPKKGQPLSDASSAFLDVLARKSRERLAADPTGEFADYDRAMLEGIAEVFEAREQGEPEPERTQQPASDGFVSADVDQINARLKALAASCHLITPATNVGQLPPGCEVAASMVHVAPGDDAGECYRPEGSSKLALTMVSLNRISQAAGISWDYANCRRVDDRKDPHYCEFSVVGSWRLFDGTIVTEQATRHIDLRDGSEETKKRTDKRIQNERIFIVEQCESKAKNRLIRRLGMKSAYTAEDLKKPFAVARLMWTGRTDDPELYKIFAVMKAQQMLSGPAGVMFGQQQLAQLSAAPPPAQLTSGEDEGDE